MVIESPHAPTSVLVEGGIWPGCSSASPDSAAGSASGSVSGNSAGSDGDPGSPDGTTVGSCSGSLDVVVMHPRVPGRVVADERDHCGQNAASAALSFRFSPPPELCVRKGASPAVSGRGGGGGLPPGVDPVIVGQHGPAVVISAETAYYLETIGKVAAVRHRLRDGRHQRVSQELLDLRQVAMSFDSSSVPQVPELNGRSAVLASGLESGELSVAEVADRLGLTPRYVRKACQSGELRAQLVGTKPRWRITEQAFEEFKAARAG